MAEIRREGKHVVLPPGFTGFLEREARASVMYIFEINLITGILQTPQYAYGVLRAGRTSDEVEQFVAKRVERQQILARQAPPRLVVVFDEAAVRRVIGGEDIMRNQIRHLTEIAERPNVTMHIVPSSRGSYAGLPGAFETLRFDDGPDVVYIEGHTTGQLVTEPDEVLQYTHRYDLIRGVAMPEDESLKLLGEMVESL